MNWKITCLFYISVLLVYSNIAYTQDTMALPNYLPHAHAHNDYAKERPTLTAALAIGVGSIEIDVFGTRRGLLVAHTAIELPWAKTLEIRYFEPLEAILQKQNGQWFDNPTQRLIFMIDIKGNSTIAYTQLRALCQKYAPLITTYYAQQDSIAYGKIDIVLSGHKPIELLQSDSIQYMTIDGSQAAIGKNNRFYPRVSMPYSSVLQWRGRGELPADQRLRLEQIIAQAHQNNQKVRLWAMPNNEKVWRTLLDMELDWLNIDKLRKYSLFYKKKFKD